MLSVTPFTATKSPNFLVRSVISTAYPCSVPNSLLPLLGYERDKRFFHPRAGLAQAPNGNPCAGQRFLEGRRTPYGIVYEHAQLAAIGLHLQYAGNPLDEWSTFDDPEYLLEILGLAYADPEISMVMVDRLVPRAAFHMTGDASLTPEVLDFVAQSEKPTVFTIDYEGGDDELTARGTALRAELCRAGIPAYPSLRRAAWALARLHEHSVHRSTSS